MVLHVLAERSLVHPLEVDVALKGALEGGPVDRVTETGQEAFEESGLVLEEILVQQGFDRQAMDVERLDEGPFGVVLPPALLHQPAEALQVHPDLGNVFPVQFTRSEFELQMSFPALPVAVVLRQGPGKYILADGQHGLHVVFLQDADHGLQVTLPAAGLEETVDWQIDEVGADMQHPRRLPTHFEAHRTAFPEGHQLPVRSLLRIGLPEGFFVPWLGENQGEQTLDLVLLEVVPEQEGLEGLPPPSVGMVQKDKIISVIIW